MRPFLIIISIFLWISSAPGQVPADTVAELPAALVLGNRAEVFGQGARQWRNDPGEGLPSLTSSLATALPLIGPVYVKSYGPGQLSSISLRGAGATHTAVIWNGFNLQNPMHGQMDFSLIPAHLFDDLRIDLGANGALWGSGAIGGAIHLGAAPPEFGAGGLVQAGVQIGSFGQNSQVLAGNWSGKYFITQTRLFRISQQNDFPFTDLAGETRRQAHAAFRQTGGMQDLFFKRKRHLLEAHLWLQQSSQQIPPILLQAVSEETQEDKNVRLALHWQYTHNRWAAHLRGAWLRDEIDYRDPAIGLAERSSSRVGYAESEAQWTPGRGHLIDFGLHQAWLKGKTENYETNALQMRQAVFGSYRVESTGKKWTGIAGIRQEWMDGKPAPLSPSLNVIWKPASPIGARLQVARHFRWPTQNDLFWAPGGNPDLKPETGWGAELGLSAKNAPGKKTEWTGDLSIFSRRIEDWILWRPFQGNFWSPQNLALVWSRGGEMSLRLKHQAGPLLMDLGAAYAAVWSTSEKSLSPNDNSLGKQLIYTPRHTLTASAGVSWKTLAFKWIQRSNGKVYTLSDHSASLPGFWITDLHLEWNFKSDDLSVLIFSNLYNIFNNSYQVVEYRPMPGRWGELGMMINFSKK